MFYHTKLETSIVHVVTVFSVSDLVDMVHGSCLHTSFRVLDHCDVGRDRIFGHR